jgi:hypothetical protein
MSQLATTYSSVASPGFVGALVPRNLDPTRPVVSGGGGVGMYPGVPVVLPRHADDAVRQYGVKIYDSMLADPAVHAAIETIKQGAIAGGLKLSTAVPPDPKLKEEEQSPDVKRAREILEFCQRLTDRLDRPIDETLFAFLDGLPYGVKLAEKVTEKIIDGPDKGKETLKSLDIKSRDVWAFVVDPFLKPLYILALAISPPEQGAPNLGIPYYQLLPLDRFAVFTWQMRDGDPRGTSILRAAYDAWNNKQHMIPLRFRYLNLWVEPRGYLELPPNASAEPQINDDGMLNLTGPREDPAKAALPGFLAWLRSGGGMVGGNKSMAHVIQATGDPAAYAYAMDWDNREMLLAIMQNTRTILEAEAGSKADSETGKSITDQVETHIQGCLCNFVRFQVYRPEILRNYGESDADRFTPNVGFGDASKEDWAAVCAGVAAIAPYLKPSQWPSVFVDKLNLPAPLPEEVKPPEPQMPQLLGPEQSGQGDGPPDGKPQPSQPPSPGSPKAKPAKAEAA